jgi:transposase
VRQWLEQQNGRIAIAFLPPYAPELNPVEAIWGYLKKHEIANLCPATLPKSVRSRAGDCSRCNADQI